MKKKENKRILKKIVLTIMLCMTLFALTACKSEKTEKKKDNSKDEKESKQEQNIETTDYFITIDGVKYTLPFKVSELEEAGFELSEYKAEEVAAKDNTHFWLEKNGLMYSFHIDNPNDSVANVMDCLVSSMGLDVVCYPKADAMVLEGIKYGTEREKVVAVSEKYESRITECEDGRVIYRISLKAGQDGSYRVDVDKDGIATYFEVYNSDFSKVFPLGISKSDNE